MASHPIVVALGGNALKSEPDMGAFPQLPPACRAMARMAGEGLVITHGNGPQIGLLAQQSGAGHPRPLDLLGAETEGLLGYSIEQEMINHLPAERQVATLLTMMEVDREDPAFGDPSKPIGPWMKGPEADRLRREKGWQFIEAAGRWRRVVPSPRPVQVLEVPALRTLLGAGTTVICAGGGGIPVVRDRDKRIAGVEAVVDKDRASALLARQLQARLLVLATDVDGVYRDWDTDRADRIERATPAELQRLELPRGSMGPKVEAACDFASASAQPAVIGALPQLEQLLAGRAGTVITQ